jgi:hypothetical protein
MDAAPTILPAELNSLLGAATAPVLVDLRSEEQIFDRLIPGAIRRSPADVQTFRTITKCWSMV